MEVGREGAGNRNLRKGCVVCGAMEGGKADDVLELYGSPSSVLIGAADPL